MTLLEDFKEFDFEALEKQADRMRCDKCGASVKWFCCHCLVSFVPLPQVHLSIPLTILKDEREKDGKSTAIHAALLAPHSTRVISVNVREFEEQIDPSCVILFPGKDSVPVDSVDWTSVASVVVIDGTWSQAASVNRLSSLSHLKRVHLSESHRTLFWRYQDWGEHCLSTIEAIYYLYKEIAMKQAEFAFEHSERLLYLFAFFYMMIQKTYKEANRSFTPKHRPNYILP